MYKLWFKRVNLVIIYLINLYCIIIFIILSIFKFWSMDTINIHTNRTLNAAHRMQVNIVYCFLGYQSDTYPEGRNGNKNMWITSQTLFSCISLYMRILFYSKADIINRVLEFFFLSIEDQFWCLCLKWHYCIGRHIPTILRNVRLIWWILRF